MDPERLGENIARSILNESNRRIDELHRIVERDRAATHVNCVALFAWIALQKLTASVPSRRVATSVDAMGARLSDSLSTESFDFSEVLNDRYDNLDRATADSSGQGGPMFNIAKYFLACCDEIRRSAPYDEIVPDPNDLEQIADLVDENALRDIKRLVAEKNVPTYPMNTEKAFAVSALLAEFSENVDAVIQSSV